MHHFLFLTFYTFLVAVVNVSGHAGMIPVMLITDKYQFFT
jgi:hypothetical protein